MNLLPNYFPLTATYASSSHFSLSKEMLNAKNSSEEGKLSNVLETKINICLLQCAVLFV